MPIVTHSHLTDHFNSLHTRTDTNRETMGQTTTDQIGAALPRAPVTLPPHLDPRQSERAFEERMLPKMNQECQSGMGNDVTSRLK